LCHGAATGEVDLTATGGTAPYSYTWSNGATTQDIINLIAGTYTVIVTDDNGCVDSLSATITEPAAPLALTATTVDVLCHGAATGEVDLTATGGTAPYSYTWSNGATTQDIINLIAGTYTVIVTDDNGCVDSLSATITEPAAPLALTATTVDVLCHGAATGEVDLTATGGTAPYSYTWSNGATTQDIINLIAGTYTVIVTDDNGCVDSLSATITEPAAPLALTATTVDVLCHGAATGEVDLTATGGTAPYTFAWSNGATTEDIINLIAGTYTVIVTDDNGCVDSLSATITEPAAPLALNATTVDVLCHGAATGEVDLTATGGTAPYSYAWSNAATSQDIINLIAGTYSVIVTDDNGCIDSLSATIIEPAMLTLSAVPDIQDCPLAAIPAIQFAASDPNATISWNSPNPLAGMASNGINMFPVFNLPVSPGPQTDSAIVFFTATLGPCSSITDSFTIRVLPAPIGNANPVQSNLCSGQSTQIQLSASLPVNGFSWNVSGASGTGAIGGNGTQINQILVNNGTSALSVTYAIVPVWNGCPGDTFFAYVNVHPLPDIALSPAFQTICNGDQVTISPSSSVPGAVFTFAPFQTGTVQGAFGGTGAVMPQTLSHFQSQPQTIGYEVSPMSSFCPGTPDTAWVQIMPDLQLSATPSQDTICSGANVLFNVSANLVGTTFNWTVVQNPNISGAIPGSGSSISQTLISTANQPESISYEVVGANGVCPGDTVVLTATVLPPPQVILPQGPLSICSGQQVNIPLASNLPGATISWLPINQPAVNGASSGNGNLINDVLSLQAAQPASTQSYIVQAQVGLCPGIPDTVLVLVNDLPIVSAGVNQFHCANSGSQTIASATPAGGIWSATGFPIAANGTFNPASALPGSYFVVYDYTNPNTGCQASDSLQTTIFPTPTVQWVVDTMLCLGTTGNFSASSSVGTQFQWQFGNGSQANSASTTHLYTQAGSYNLSLISTDINGCSDTLNQVVDVVAPPQPSFQIVNPNGCAPHSTPVINTSQGSFTSYVWNFGNGQQSTDYQPDTIHYTSPIVSDTSVVISLSATNICGTFTATDTVTLYAPVNAQFSSSVGGGCSPLTMIFTNISTGSVSLVQWNFGNGTTSNAFNPGNAQYTNTGTVDSIYWVTLYIQNQCNWDTTSQPILVNPNVVTAAFNSDVQQGCGPLGVTFTNGSLNAVTLNWNFGDGNISNQPNPYHVYLNPGTYQVSLAATDGCTYDTAWGQITVHPNPDILAWALQDTVCPGTPIQFQSATNALNSLNWNFGDGNQSNLSNPQHLYANPGTYWVTFTGISNPHGCADSVIFPIFVAPGAQVQPVLSDSLGCAPFTITFSNAGIMPMFLNWNFADGTMGVGSPSQHTYTQPGHYIVRAVGFNQWSCSDSSTANVWIFPSPQAAFIAPSGPICSVPSTVSFTNVSQQAISYNWQFPGGQSNQQHPQFNFQAPGIHTVTLIATNEFGCSDTTAQQVVVSEPVIANFAIWPDTAGCAPLFVQLQNLSEGADMFHWILPNGQISNDSIPSFTLHQPGVYGITLIASNKHGCRDTASKTNAIYVYPNPIAGFIISPNPVDALNPVVYIQDRSEGATYSFYDMGNGFIVEQGNQWYTYPGVNQNEYLVMQVVINEFGCTDTAWNNLIIIPQTTFYVPSAFSPNQDGKNETFRAYGINVFDFHMEIFNRWGQLLYEVFDIKDGWDGTMFNQGGPVSKSDVYVYKISYRDVHNQPFRVRGKFVLTNNGTFAD
jgi:large repetitive protein